MLHNNSFVLCLIAFMAVGCLVALGFYLGGEARLRRRRRKSHSRIISNARQPTVKFSVKTPRDE